MQTENDTTKPEDSPEQEDGEGWSGAPCSRAFADLLESLDEWIDDALENSRPIGLTLSRARVTITDQYDRIGEILDAMERQNHETERLRNAIRSFVTDFERIPWGWDGDCGSKELVDALFDSISANV
jgi:hypothetical protein